MLRVNSFTVSCNEFSKNQLTALLICIFIFSHDNPPFCGLTTAWFLASYGEKKARQ